MALSTIDTLLGKVENKYALVMLAAKRARELYEGEDSLIDEFFINPVTVSINEIDQDKIKCYLEEDPDIEEDHIA